MEDMLYGGVGTQTQTSLVKDTSMKFVESVEAGRK